MREYGEVVLLDGFDNRVASSRITVRVICLLEVL